MRKAILHTVALFCATFSFAQTNPIITAWLQNTTVTARHYVSGNSTAINDTSKVNVQAVQYSANYVYATTTGLPSYVTGPFLDGNPSLATNQKAIFKFPLVPTANTGTPTPTTGGNIGVFINGVALFDYRDGVAWSASTNSLCGGPGNPPCSGGPGSSPWNRDAIPAERGGFDCSKGHPAMGNYHHHQNPSAFKLDLNVLSTICNLYNADGLYAIDSSVHSPLIGFAYDGFPIYGAYAYKNVNGTGGIVRMKSSYTLRNISTRTTSPTGATVASGPNVSSTYPLGYFREDYQYNTTSTATPDYLDEHNGRFCITPEYPSGIYCYFATVDANWNSAYPYVVGPTFYGNKVAVKVTSISEPVTVYHPALPVTWKDFFGEAKATVNQLYWQTVTESNNLYFDIEKSANGNGFEMIGKVKGHGNSTMQQQYTFTDKKPFAKANYYRLKQVDADGKSVYSKTIVINQKAEGNAVHFTFYPNPANDFLLVQTKGLVKENYDVKMYDLTGRLVRSTAMYQGSTIAYIDTKTLYSGEYAVTITNSQGATTRRIVVNKE